MNKILDNLNKIERKAELLNTAYESFLNRDIIKIVKDTKELVKNINNDALLGVVANNQEEVKAEDCILESAFLLDDGIRLMVGSSCQYGITTYQCDEDWKPIKYACKGAPLIGFDSFTDFHKHTRKQHGEEKLVVERSSKLNY